MDNGPSKKRNRSCVLPCSSQSVVHFVPLAINLELKALQRMNYVPNLSSVETIFMSPLFTMLVIARGTCHGISYPFCSYSILLVEIATRMDPFSVSVS